ncbi:helix-hairpin-helix domain-containing protein [bacterium]|nr:helix-hairpin-helix domain-containing protein [bacterium]
MDEIFSGGEALDNFRAENGYSDKVTRDFDGTSERRSSEGPSLAVKIKKKVVGGNYTVGGSEMEKPGSKSMLPVMQIGHSGAQEETPAYDYSSRSGIRADSAMAGALNRGIVPESLRRMQEAEQIYEAEKKGIISSGDSALESVLKSGSNKDRFVPTHKEIIKELSKSAEAKKEKAESGKEKAESSKKSGASVPSRAEDGKDKNAVSADADDKWREKQKKKIAVSIGILCFLIGGLLLTFLYSPLNERGAERVFTDGGGGNTAESAAGGGSELLPDAAADGGAKEDSEKVELDVSQEQLEGLQPQVFRSAKGTIKVYVVGAVRNPGMVSLPFDARVDDAVKAAGGMTEDAEPLSVNLAKRIKDEDKIYVPSKGESSGTVGSPAGLDNSGVMAHNTYGSAVPEGSGVINVREPDRGKGADSRSSSKKEGAKKKKPAAADSAPAGGQAESVVSEEVPDADRIDINTASEEELQKIPGVGPSISKSIVDYRSSLPEGRFTDKAQLKEVIGVGNSTYDKIEGYVKEVK